MTPNVTLRNVESVAAALAAVRKPEPAKSLAEAVCRVMERVGYVKKDKQMTGGGSYKYVSVEAVIDKLRPEMVKEGLALLPAGLEVLHQGDHGRQVHLRLKYTFDLLHHPSNQSRPVVVVGEGMDVGDKAGNKAMTAARKYAMVMAFNLETGDDPDDTPSREQERAAPAEPLQESPDWFASEVQRLTGRPAFDALWEKFTKARGRWSPADVERVFGMFGTAAKKFPKPQPQEPAKK